MLSVIFGILVFISICIFIDEYYNIQKENERKQKIADEEAKIKLLILQQQQEIERERLAEEFRQAQEHRKKLYEIEQYRKAQGILSSRQVLQCFIVILIIAFFVGFLILKI